MKSHKSSFPLKSSLLPTSLRSKVFTHRHRDAHPCALLVSPFSRRGYLLNDKLLNRFYSAPSVGPEPCDSGSKTFERRLVIIVWPNPSLPEGGGSSPKKGLFMPYFILHFNRQTFLRRAPGCASSARMARWVWARLKINLSCG